MTQHVVCVAFAGSRHWSWATMEVARSSVLLYWAPAPPGHSLVGVHPGWRQAEALLA